MNQDQDPVVLLERLAIAVAERGRAALNVWEFIGVLVRIERERPEYIAGLASPDRQLFHDAKNAALREFDGPVQ
jgi:hypothetical protein